MTGKTGGCGACRAECGACAKRFRVTNWRAPCQSRAPAALPRELANRRRLNGAESDPMATPGDGVCRRDGAGRLNRVTLVGLAHRNDRPYVGQLHARLSWGGRRHPSRRHPGPGSHHWDKTAAADTPGSAYRRPGPRVHKAPGDQDPRLRSDTSLLMMSLPLRTARADRSKGGQGNLARSRSLLLGEGKIPRSQDPKLVVGG